MGIADFELISTDEKDLNRYQNHQIPPGGCFNLCVNQGVKLEVFCFLRVGNFEMFVPS